jgi:hypothetical protein
MESSVDHTGIAGAGMAADGAFGLGDHHLPPSERQRAGDR